MIARFYEKYPVLFWICYGVVYLTVAGSGLIFSYWIGKTFFETMVK